jgi:uncharacterized membrane protein YdjX (TVP38/TMEM64 family)
MKKGGDRPTRRTGASIVWKAAAAVGVGAAVILLAREGAGFVPGSLDAIQSLGPWAAIAYIGLYILATVAWVPGSVLTLASGAIFGLARGTVFTLVGATLGASLAFLVSRYLARGPLEKRIGADPRLSSMDEAIQKQGAKLIFLIRLSPVFPFNFLNYALGLTAVRLRDYAFASAVGMAPGTFMYVYAGYAAGQVAMSASGTLQRGPGSYAMLGVGLLATAAVTVLVTRIARRALREATDLNGSAAKADPGGDIPEGIPGPPFQGSLRGASDSL